MLHRHLTHQQFTLVAIDDVIARGKRRDWAELRRVALADRSALGNDSARLRGTVPVPEPGTLLLLGSGLLGLGLLRRRKTVK